MTTEANKTFDITSTITINPTPKSKTQSEYTRRLH